MLYNGTSEPEQSIFYYVKRYFPDAINRYVYSHDYSISKGVEIDIYIPSICVAIEYDGAFWHKDKVDSDTLKNYYLNNNGIYVIRVRDCECPSLPKFNGLIFYHGKPPIGKHTNECIENVIRTLATFCKNKETISQLKTFSLSFEKYKQDLPDIISVFYPDKVLDNKSNFCGAEYWDKECNGRLILENIPSDTKNTIYANFRCKCNYKLHFDINDMHDKRSCRENCHNCWYRFCPFILVCKQKCEILIDLIENHIIKYELVSPHILKMLKDKNGNIQLFWANQAIWQLIQNQ